VTLNAAFSLPNSRTERLQSLRFFATALTRKTDIMLLMELWFSDGPNTSWHSQYR